MLPTLNGRIQTRIFLVVVIGGIWTAIITPLVRLFMEGDPSLGDAYTVTYTVLAIVLVLGIVWEFVYQVLMQFRWEKDWPTFFGYLTGINEGIAAYLVAKALAVDPTETAGAPEWRIFLEGLTVAPFLVDFVTTWIVIQLFAGNYMKMIFLRWRFKGGRLIGGW